MTMTLNSSAFRLSIQCCSISHCKYHLGICTCLSVQSVQSVSHVQLFVTVWTAARQASLSITSSQSLLKLMSIGSVMPSNHLILCRPFWSGLPCPPPGTLPDPGTERRSSCVSCTAGSF